MTSKAQMVISFKFLFSVYSVIPICGLLVLLDGMLYDFELRDALPKSPMRNAIFQALFGLPHIVASNLILFSNREYFGFFQTKLLWAAALIAAFLGLGSYYLSYNMMFFIISALTVTHVLKQQQGLGNALYRLSGHWYTAWCYLGILIGVLLYAGIFQGRLFSQEQAGLYHMVMMLLVIIYLGLSSFLLRSIGDRSKWYFFIGNVFIVVVPWLFYLGDYMFFAILVPRVIHDLSAFMVYITHNHNRLSSLNDRAKKVSFNLLDYRAFVLVPAVAIIVALLINHQLDSFVFYLSVELLDMRRPIAASIAVITFLSLMHYYTESFAWHKGSPLRKFVAFR